MTLAIVPDPRHLPPSPCVGICDLDPETGLCRGCARSGGEIAGWADLAPSRQAAVWAALPERQVPDALEARVLPASGAALTTVIRDAITSGTAVLAMGAPGAQGRFAAPPGGAGGLDLIAGGGAVRAVTPRAGLALDLSDKVRAFAAADGLVLALPIRRGSLPRPAGVTALGPDTDALRAADRAAPLFDLGLPGLGGRLCVRTADPTLAALMSRHAGCDLGSAAPLWRALADHRADWVAVSALGRVELFGTSAEDTAAPDAPGLVLDRGGAGAAPFGPVLPPAYLACVEGRLDRG